MDDLLSLDYSDLDGIEIIDIEVIDIDAVLYHIDWMQMGFRLRCNF